MHKNPKMTLKHYLLNFSIFLNFSRLGFSMSIPGCPGTHCLDQAGFELRNLPASASQVLVLKVWAITAQLRGF